MTDQFDNNQIPEQPQAPQADPFQNPVPPQAPNPQAAYDQAAQQGYTQPDFTQQYQQQQQQPQYQQPAYQQPYQQPAQQPRYNVPPAGYQQKSRLAAGLLALIVGCFGVHNFYLGFNTKATIQLVVAIVGSLLCGAGIVAMAVWAIVEGVQILSASNPDRNYDANGVILRD